jgi:glucose/mannose-6-phosphate isomerase
MNIDLNDLETIKNNDKEDMAQKIADLPMQIKRGWEESQKIIIPSYYLKADKVVILGMGGSGISGALVKNLMYLDADIPVFIHRDYGIPGFVDNKTLVIAVSYSGNTEEILDSFVAAYSKGAKLFAITTGGKLESLSKKYRVPLFKFEYNSQPRASAGYTFSAILGIFKKIGIYKDIYQKDIDDVIEILKKQIEIFKPDSPIRKNLSKQIANDIYEHIPIIWAGGNLEETARRWKCQMNENAKNSSYYEVLPELNHNSICDFDFPIPKKLFVLILKSKFYFDRVYKRIEISQDLLNQKQIPNKLIEIENANSLLSEILSFLILGDYVSFYLATLHNVDPTPVNAIKNFKEKLK